MTRQIRTLENRLDKAMIKYNEAQSIRRTYEQIVKRLKEERIGFDNQRCRGAHVEGKGSRPGGAHSDAARCNSLEGTS